MTQKIFIYLFNGYSDWEIAYLAPELQKSKEHELIYFNENAHSIKSMGGLQVQPTVALSEVKVDEIDLLILPGGEIWEKESPEEIKNLLLKVHQSKNSVAAICAATTFLGHTGLLDKVKHTSNDLNYLKAIAPNYKGEALYQNTLAITDNNVTTANGIAPIEFAREVFRAVDLYNEEHLEKWFQLFKNGIWKE